LVHLRKGQRRQRISGVSHLMNHRLGGGGGYGYGVGNQSQINFESGLRLLAKKKAKASEKEKKWRRYQFKDRSYYPLIPPYWKAELRARKKLEPIKYNNAM
jgi:hypothetical protein